VGSGAARPGNRSSGSPESRTWTGRVTGVDWVVHYLTIRLGTFAAGRGRIFKLARRAPGRTLCTSASPGFAPHAGIRVWVPGACQALVASSSSGRVTVLAARARAVTEPGRGGWAGRDAPLCTHEPGWPPDSIGQWPSGSLCSPHVWRLFPDEDIINWPVCSTRSRIGQLPPSAARPPGNRAWERFRCQTPAAGHGNPEVRRCLLEPGGEV
jgi:hypothetical protein